MTIKEIRAYCRSKWKACEDYPFGDIPICYRLNKKIFAQIYPNPCLLYTSCNVLSYILLHRYLRNQLHGGFRPHADIQIYRRIYRSDHGHAGRPHPLENGKIQAMDYLGRSGPWIPYLPSFHRAGLITEYESGLRPVSYTHLDKI